MEPYFLAKTLHILSATLLFGTGLGIAFFFWMGGRSGSDEAAYFAARATVLADLIFTATAVVLQPLTGAWLIGLAGHDPFAPWLVWTYALYLLAGACWVPVVLLQLRIRDQLRRKLDGGPFDAALYARRRAWWFLLGWPAFLAVIVIIHLMVAKPA